jgi:hypothetical protein
VLKNVERVDAEQPSGLQGMVSTIERLCCCSVARAEIAGVGGGRPLTGMSRPYRPDAKANRCLRKGERETDYTLAAARY